MNSRVTVVVITLVLALSMYLARKSAHRESAELSDRISQVEEQMQTIKQSASVSERDQLRGENERLRGENKELRASLADAKRKLPTMMDPRTRTARVSTSASENDAYDPLAFYRRNPELMKRYFPQLYKAEMEKKEKIPAPPKE